MRSGLPLRRWNRSRHFRRSLSRWIALQRHELCFVNVDYYENYYELCTYGTGLRFRPTLALLPCSHL